MSKFKKGDRVRCIDASHTRYIRLGIDYVVREVIHSPVLGDCLYIENLSCGTYSPWRFALIGVDCNERV